MTIALAGCRLDMPDEFPVDFPENSGNLIHGLAPTHMFDDCVHPSQAPQGPAGYKTFAEFANNECSHLILTVANFFKVGDPDPGRYTRLQHMLEQYEIPVVIFGMGAQAENPDVSSATLPDAAVDLMRFLGERTPVVGLRGQFTADLFREAAGVTNTMVTGCPSFFSMPDAFPTLRGRLREPLRGTPAYVGTTYHEDREGSMLERAILERSNMIEQVNKFAYSFHSELKSGNDAAALPWFLKKRVGADQALSAEQVKEHFLDRFRLFRNMGDWLQFHRESTSFSYGTRFHGNMAALLAGVPGLWVTHDSRTVELTDFLRVPRVTLDDAAQLTVGELESKIDYEPMFDELPALFRNFNDYLEIHKLPPLTLRF